MSRLHDSLQAVAVLCIFSTCLLGDSYTLGEISFWVPAGLVAAAVITWIISIYRKVGSGNETRH